MAATNIGVTRSEGMAGWRLVLWVALVVAAVFFLYMVRGILLPFVAALVISVLLDPTVKKLRMRGYPRWLAIGMVFATFLGVITLLGLWLAPMVGGQLSQFRGTVEEFTNQMGAPDPSQNFFARWSPAVTMQKPKENSLLDQGIAILSPTFERLGLPSTKREIIDQYIAPHRKDIAAYVENFFKGAFGLIPAFGMLILSLIITPLLVVYMLVDMDRLKRRSATWIPPSIRAETLEMLRDIGQVFETYLRGVTTAILLYMGMSVLILSIVGAPYSILLGVLFGALYLIPYIGPALSWITLFLLTGFAGKTAILGFPIGSPWTAAIIVTLIFLVADRSFDLFVYPQIVGKSVGLNPIVSFFVVFSGGALFGLPGMLLAFPLAGAVKVVLDRLIRVTSYSSDTVRLPVVPLRHRAAG